MEVMNKASLHRLNDILNNKSLGSSELVLQLNKYFLSGNVHKSDFMENFKLIKKKLGHFEIVNSYLKELEHKIISDDDSELIEVSAELH